MIWNSLHWGPIETYFPYALKLTPLFISLSIQTLKSFFMADFPEEEGDLIF